MLASPVTGGEDLVACAIAVQVPLDFFMELGKLLQSNALGGWSLGWSNCCYLIRRALD
jgi:hypothetical protein